MLLLSGIGKPYDPQTEEGVGGRNYSYQTVSTADGFYDESVNINPFMASGANGTMIDDFGADNFDHAPHKFVGGAFIGSIMTNGRPIQSRAVPPGTPTWGLEWKKAVARHYNHTVSLQAHGSSSSMRTNYLDLDPTYKDAWGLPLLRITFDYPQNDLRMSAFVTDKMKGIADAMGGKIVNAKARTGSWDVTQYQTTHNVGGAVMGEDPKTSAVNRYLQTWDVPNVFVVGGSAFPQNSNYNPTGTVGALAYWAVDAIKNKYLKNPGALV